MTKDRLHRIKVEQQIEKFKGFYPVPFLNLDMSNSDLHGKGKMAETTRLLAMQVLVQEFSKEVSKHFHNPPEF